MNYLKILKLKDKIVQNNFYFALVLVIIYILIAIFLGFYSNKVIPGNSAVTARYTLEPSTHLDFLSEWDGPHYLFIAQHGYTNNSSITGFFPIYPLLISFMLVIVHSALISGLLVSWVSLVLAVYFLLKILDIFKKNNDSNNKLLGALLFLLYPTGIFLVATYTESLFAFLALAAIYFALKKRYLLASLFCALSTGTHPNGVLIAILIAAIAIENKEKLMSVIYRFVLSLSGLFGYMIFLYFNKHDFLDFLDSQRHNGWLSSHYFSSIINTISPIDCLILVIIAISVYYWRKKRPSFALYSLLLFLLPFGGGDFSGYPRYTLMAFPVFLMIYEKITKSKTLYICFIIISTILWSYFVIHYSAGYTGGS